MGRTKGTKNRVGHKAGGARKGAGRKPRVSEEPPKDSNIIISTQDNDSTPNTPPEHYPLRPLFDDFAAARSPSGTSDLGAQQLLTPLSLSSQPLPLHDSLDVPNLTSLESMNTDLGQPHVTSIQVSHMPSSGQPLDIRPNNSLALCHSPSNLARPYLTPNGSSLLRLPSYDSVTSNHAMSKTPIYQPSHTSNYTSPLISSNMILSSSTAAPSTPVLKPWSTSSELSNALGFPCSTSSMTPSSTSPGDLTYLSPLGVPISLPTLNLPSPSPSVSSSPDYSHMVHQQGQAPIGIASRPDPTSEQHVWDFPYPLPAALGDPDQRPFAMSVNMIHKRRRRRCLVCVHVGMEHNSYECPGRGSRAKCPSYRHNESVESPKRFPAARISFAHDSNPPPPPVSMHSLLTSDDNHLQFPAGYATLENVQKRTKRCMVCVGNGKEGTTCPGRGNRSLCPDYRHPV